jgi:hypothetical protein
VKNLYNSAIRLLTFVLLSPLYAMGIMGVAAPQFGSMTFVGLASGKTYNVDIYHSDVVDGLINFDGGAGSSATSPDSWSAPEAVILSDYTIITGMTDTTKLQILKNNQPTGGFLRFSLWLNTLQNRPALRLGYLAGQEIRCLQKA